MSGEKGKNRNVVKKEVKEEQGEVKEEQGEVKEEQGEVKQEKKAVKSRRKRVTPPPGTSRGPHPASPLGAEIIELIRDLPRHSSYFWSCFCSCSSPDLAPDSAHAPTFTAPFLPLFLQARLPSSQSQGAPVPGP